MRKEIQAYVAQTTAHLSASWSEMTLWDKDREEMVRIDPRDFTFVLQQYPFKEGCGANKSCDGVNHCLVDTSKDQHICLSLYGKLFDGYDHSSASHFSGMVYDDAVEIYDYSESDFFRFEKA